MDANCSYVSGATRTFGVDFREVAERSARIAEQSGHRLEDFFDRNSEAERKIDEEFSAALESEVEQWWQRIATLEAELALAWEGLAKADEASARARAHSAK